MKFGANATYGEETYVLVRKLIMDGKTRPEIRLVTGMSKSALSDFVVRRGLTRAKLGLPGQRNVYQPDKVIMPRIAPRENPAITHGTDEARAALYAGRQYDDEPRACRAESAWRVPQIPTYLAQEASC